MARPIDADALVDAMTGACNIFDAQGADTTLARVLITIADKAPTIGGWISVKDHPPKKDEDVIIYGYYVGQSGETYPTTVISDIEEFKYRGFVPIAWMPCPEWP